MRIDSRREEELAEAAVEESDTGLEREEMLVLFRFNEQLVVKRHTPKTRRLRTMVAFSGLVASS
jgi:hypothetical protein